MARFIFECNETKIDLVALAAAMEGEAESDAPLFSEIVFVSEEEIQNLNRETRNIDAVTDVLSYPNLDGIKGRALRAKDFAFDSDEDGNLYLGSVAICTKRAEEQAKEYGHSQEREFTYLAVHGLCHLLGYDHMNEEDKKEMREKEERILQKLGVVRE